MVVSVPNASKLTMQRAEADVSAIQPPEESGILDANSEGDGDEDARFAAAALAEYYRTQ